MHILARVLGGVSTILGEFRGIAGYVIAGVLVETRGLLEDSKDMQ